MTAFLQSASAGLVEVAGTRKDLRLGSLIKGRGGSNDDVWRIVDIKSPEQYDFHFSPWYLIEKVTTGERVAIPPTAWTNPVTIMVPEDKVLAKDEMPTLDRAALPPVAPPTDQDAVDLLAGELGAVLLAEKDNVTGAIVCPPYEQMHPPRHDEYVAHLEVAHGIDLDGVNTADIEALTTLHGRDHRRGRSGTFPGAGFPHHHNYSGVPGA